ncbi:Tetratricopeptide repeat-containing protein [Marininema halotolerans]|uniref:Tetratricopeptide repeat-containing protein n=2 Tax=Marininema halotolerans TaxID=1155944 RepID=A0A1I6SGJ3_9BACL|nr:Tetratricopeptide repeat-containing protein [Marininema halotolerans]
MTQAELAEGIISVPYLSLIENEKAHPRPDIIQPLAKRLQSTVQHLMGVTDRETLREAEYLLNRIHRSLLSQGAEHALKELDGLKNLAQQVNDSNLLIQIDLLEINCYIHQMNDSLFNKKMDDFEDRWELSEIDPNLLVRYIRLKGNTHLFRDRYQEALAHYKEAETHIQNVTNDVDKAYLYGEMSKVYLHLSNYPFCILYAERSIELLVKNDRWLEMCHQLNVLGTCHSRSGDFKQALNCFERVLRLADQFSMSQLLFSYTYHEMGCCYMRLDETDQAIYYLTRSLEMIEPYQVNDWEIGRIHQALCQTYLSNGLMDLARQHIDQAILHLQTRKKRLAECMIFSGQIEYHTGRIPEFLQQYKEAICLFRQVKATEQLAHACHTLGRFYLENGNKDEAIHYFHQASESYYAIIPSISIPVELPTKPIANGDQPSPLE